MEPYTPFAGVILLPDKAPFGSSAPVLLGDGQPVATIRWHRWTARARFDILDPHERIELASGGRIGVWGRRWQVTGPRSEVLLELKLGLWGPSGRNAVTLPDGRTLHTQGNWTSRKFSVVDETGGQVALLVNTSQFLSWRPDSLAFELRIPTLSLVQAIGLAQCVRAAVEGQRVAFAASNGGAVTG